MNRRYTGYNGILLLNKRLDITSHQAIAEVRRIIRQKRVGHTGTLDPKAQGLIVVCIGRATKVVQFVSDFDKTYEAEIYLGRTSSTFDSEGIIKEGLPKIAPNFSLPEFQEVLNEFSGKKNQRVPAYSAVRVNGNRLYEFARAGVEVELPVREIEIKSIQAVRYENPKLTFIVTCSKGTYIRTLASDIGQRLECGAYLSNLNRTAIGSMELKNALSIEKVEQLHISGELSEKLLSFDDVLNFSGILVTDKFRSQVLNGLDLRPSDVLGTQGEFAEGDCVLLKDQEGTPLAIGRAEVDSSRIRTLDTSKIFTYTRVLN